MASTVGLRTCLKHPYAQSKPSTNAKISIPAPMATPPFSVSATDKTQFTPASQPPSSPCNRRDCRGHKRAPGTLISFQSSTEPPPGENSKEKSTCLARLLAVPPQTPQGIPRGGQNTTTFKVHRRLKSALRSNHPMDVFL